MHTNRYGFSMDPAYYSGMDEIVPDESWGLCDGCGGHDNRTYHPETDGNYCSLCVENGVPDELC